MVAIALRLPSIKHTWSSYNKALKQQPIATKAATCMVGFALGDSLAQLTCQEGPLLQRVLRIDVARTARMAGFGMLFSGPVGHYWYDWLERVILPKHPMNPVAIAAKVVADQLVYTPFGTLTFFVYNNLLQFQHANIAHDIYEKLWPTLLAGWTLWPPAMVINMAFIPAHLRIVYINAVSLIWTNILSRMATSQASPDHETVHIQEGFYHEVLHPAYVVLDEVFDLVEDAFEPVIDPLYAAFEPIQEKYLDPVCDRVETAYESVQDGFESWKDRIPLDTTPRPKTGLEVHPIQAFPFASD